MAGTLRRVEVTWPRSTAEVERAVVDTEAAGPRIRLPCLRDMVAIMPDHMVHLLQVVRYERERQSTVIAEKRVDLLAAD